MKQCPKCGKIYSAKTNFCTVDGEALIATETSKAREAETLTLPKENSQSEGDASTHSQWDMGGSYIQERDEENTNAPGDTSPHIRCDALQSTATVFFNSETGKWQITENTFWKYYWASDLSNLNKRGLVGSSWAEVIHREYGRRGGKILMTGHHAEGEVGLELEPLLVDKKKTAEIHEALKKEINFIKTHYKESRTEWSLDECGNLIKEKSYGPGEPVKIEKFIRRF